MESKEQEALDFIKKAEPYLPNALVRLEFVGKTITLQKLVDKATPKKIIVKQNYCLQYYLCPSCLKEIGYSSNKNDEKYCSCCGQALDWKMDNIDINASDKVFEL